MKIQPAVVKETTKIAIGTVILSLVMLAVFALLGMLDSRVLLGTLLGTVTAILNFFLMALSVQKAAARMNGVTLPAEEPTEEDEEGESKPKPDTPEVQQAKHAMQLSYTGRMLMLVAVGIVALSVPAFHPVPVAIALLFPRIIVSINGLVESKRKEEA